MTILLLCGDGELSLGLVSVARSRFGINVDRLAYWYWSKDEDNETEDVLCLAMCDGRFILFRGSQADRIAGWLERSTEQIDGSLKRSLKSSGGIAG
jgi:hypothetical protein